MADKWTLVPCPCGHPKCTDVMIPGVVEQQGALSREHGELIVKAVNSYEAFSLSQIEHDMLGCSMTKTGIYAQANERTKRDEPQCVYEARSRTGDNSAANGIQDAWCRTHGFDCPNAGPQKSLALRGEPVAGRCSSDDVERTHHVCKFCSASISAVPISGEPWVPTHRHADGGEYRYLGECKMKMVDGIWHDGVLYETKDGVKCSTHLTRWHDRFEEIK